MLTNHGDALEADFQRVYGIDLVDLYRGNLTPRKAQVLAFNLPPGALTWQEMGSDNAWTVTDHLLADAVDALNGANFQRGGGKGEKPKPVPRPAELRELKERRQAMLDKATRFQQRQRKRAMPVIVPGPEGLEDD